MRYVLIAVIILGTIVSVSIAAVAQGSNDTPSFPGEHEIGLLATQAERAFGTYDSAVKLEAIEFGAEAGASKDLELSATANEVLAKLKKEPNRFNSPFGFLLIIDLDDASRNMAVSIGQASNSSMALAIDGKVSAATQKLEVGQTCLAASNLLYTVSENATELYEKYLVANAVLQGKAVDALNECRDAITKCSKAH